MKFHKIAFILLVIGGLNWLLQGLFNKDLFVLFGLQMSNWLPRVVYILVGLSAISELMSHKRLCKMCETGSRMSSM